VLRASSRAIVDGALSNVRAMARTPIPPLSHAGNRNAVLRLELLVSRLFLHVHTLQDKVLHFIFKAAPILPAFVSQCLAY
jgi:hypothetical protein